MTASLFEIGDVHFVAAPECDRKSGLRGWIALTTNGQLRLDGIALRRTADGRLTLSFPARRDAQGYKHFYVRPVDDRARREIEHQIFAALSLKDVAR